MHCEHAHLHWGRARAPWLLICLTRAAEAAMPPQTCRDHGAWYSLCTNFSVAATIIDQAAAFDRKRHSYKTRKRKFSVYHHPHVIDILFLSARACLLFVSTLQNSALFAIGFRIIPGTLPFGALTRALSLCFRFCTNCARNEYSLPLQMFSFSLSTLPPRNAMSTHEMKRVCAFSCVRCKRGHAIAQCLRPRRHLHHRRSLIAT